MKRTWMACLAAGVLVVACWSSTSQAAGPNGFNPNRYFHYPYYYFPHNYWPMMGPKWPEPPGSPPLPPPAYMAYPPFREPHWRYEWWEPQTYHRGFHFWLDQF